jgi:uncharacterized protein
MTRTATNSARFDPCGWAHASGDTPRASAARHAAPGAPTAAGTPTALQPSDFGWVPGVAPRLPVDDGSTPHLDRVRALGLSGVMDAHTHWFPDNVNAKIWDYFDRHYWPVTYRGTTERRLEQLRAQGVRRFTTLTYAHRPGMAEWLNGWTGEFCARVPEAIPCGTFYPEPEAPAYVRRAIERDGVRGFKIHVRVGAFDPNAPALEAVFEQITAAGLPVVTHVGNAPDAGEFTTLAVAQRLLARHPALRLIVAHMGAFDFADYLALAERHPNVALDTTMVFVGFTGCDPFPPHLVPRLEAISDRVLFGSDFPTIPYPFSHAVQGVLALPLSDAAKRRILWDNAQRWFGVTA